MRENARVTDSALDAAPSTASDFGQAEGATNGLLGIIFLLSPGAERGAFAAR